MNQYTSTETKVMLSNWDIVYRLFIGDQIILYPETLSAN